MDYETISECTIDNRQAVDMGYDLMKAICKAGYLVYFPHRQAWCFDFGDGDIAGWHGTKMGLTTKEPFQMTQFEHGTTMEMVRQIMPFVVGQDLMNGQAMEVKGGHYRKFGLTYSGKWINGLLLVPVK